MRTGYHRQLDPTRHVLKYRGTMRTGYHRQLDSMRHVLKYRGRYENWL